MSMFDLIVVVLLATKDIKKKTKTKTMMLMMIIMNESMNESD